MSGFCNNLHIFPYAKCVNGGHRKATNRIKSMAPVQWRTMNGPRICCCSQLNQCYSSLGKSANIFVRSGKSLESCASRASLVMATGWKGMTHARTTDSPVWHGYLFHSSISAKIDETRVISHANGWRWCAVQRFCGWSRDLIESRPKNFW